MPINGLSTYTQIVTDGLKRDLGQNFIQQVDGTIDRNGDGRLDQKDRDGVAQSDESWQYFFDNVGRYRSLMNRLEKAGFEHPFDVDGPNDSDMRLVDFAKEATRGIRDEVEKGRALYKRIIPVDKGGFKEEDEGLDITVNMDMNNPGLRPTGPRMPLQIFSEGITAASGTIKRFAQCTEYSYMFAGMARSVGLNAFMVDYEEGDYKCLSTEHGRKKFKEMAAEIKKKKKGHQYVYMIVGGGEGYIVDPGNGIFERALKAPSRIFNYRETAAEHLSQKGHALKRYGHDPTEMFKAAYEIGPEKLCACVYDHFGHLYYDRGDFKEALKMFKESLRRLSPDVCPACTYNMIGLTYRALGNRSEAMKMYRKAIEEDPDLAVAYNNLAGLYYDRRDYAEAIRIYGISASKDPDRPNTFYNLGLAHKYSGDRAEALKAFKRAQALARKQGKTDLVRDVSEAIRRMGEIDSQ